MTHPRRLFLAALAVALVQMGVLAWMILARAAILREGAEVVLEVQPVDPRDLLRGDYVTISYNVSNLPRALFETLPPPGTSGPWPVHVRLRAGEDGIWQASAARVDAEFSDPPAQGEVELRGLTRAAARPNMTNIPVVYGIERFYVPEGQGRPIEQGLGTRSFRMAVAVAADGTAQIKALYDGEQMLFREPLY